jgi:hypothetical protein
MSKSIEDAKSHLRVALLQVTPKDDEIIVGHMRDALMLLPHVEPDGAILHQAQKMYPARAYFDFVERTQAGNFSMFVVYCGGHALAESEDSEVADFICEAWNARFKDNS